MPLLRNAFGKPEQRSLRRLPALTGTSTASSVSVTPERSLQIGAVYSCVRLLSEAVAGLPVGMFERKPDSRVPVPSHPLLGLVRDHPNSDIDAAELWRTVVGWMLLRGNAYVYVERNNGGSPVGLWPVSPQAVEVKRTESGRLVYKVRLDMTEYAPITERNGNVQAENMLHYRAFGLGTEGLSPVGLARQSVGIAFAAQSYVGGFFARDASPGGVVSVPGSLTDEQYERLERQWKSLHEGFDKAHKLAVMEGGSKWEATTLSPSDAQFIETQKFSRGEIASIFGVPPHMIGDTEKSTSWGSGIAEQGIGFVTYSLRPWLNRLERVTGRLLQREARDLRLRWNVDGLMEGDTKARYDAYAVGKQWGWLSTNDIRRREDEEPIENGDAYLQPLNMVPAGSTLPPAQRSGQVRRALDEPVAQGNAAWVTRNQDLLSAAFGEQRAEVLGNIIAGRTPLDREEWDGRLAQLLLGPAVDLTRELGSETAASFGSNFVLDWTVAYLGGLMARQASNLNITTAGQVEQAVAAAEDEGADPVERVNRVFDEAVGTRAALVSAAVVNQVGNFARHEGAYQAGARTKTWRTTSTNPRSAHARMNGETVPIDQPFSNRAMWPHDPAAGADDTANCRCRVEFSTEEP